MIQETLTQRYTDAGIVIHRNHKGFKEILEKEDDQGGTRKLELVGLDGEVIQVNELLWAIGRNPDTRKLNLAKTGVQQTSRGHIKVDEFQNTNIEGIYALGYVHFRPVQAHFSQRLHKAEVNRSRRRISYHYLSTMSVHKT